MAGHSAAPRVRFSTELFNYPYPKLWCAPCQSGGPRQNNLGWRLRLAVAAILRLPRIAAGGAQCEEHAQRTAGHAPRRDSTCGSFTVSYVCLPRAQVRERGLPAGAAVHGAHGHSFASAAASGPPLGQCWCADARTCLRAQYAVHTTLLLKKCILVSGPVSVPRDALDASPGACRDS